MVSYLFDHPFEATEGGTAFVKRALADPLHPSRTYQIHPVLDSEGSQAFVIRLANECMIVYDHHE